MIYVELKKNLVLLEKASKDKDFKITAVLTKNLKKLRKSFDLPDTVKALSFYLSDLFFRLDLPCQPRDEPEGVSLNEYMHCKDDRSQEIMAHAEP